MSHLLEPGDALPNNHLDLVRFIWVECGCQLIVHTKGLNRGLVTEQSNLFIPFLSADIPSQFSSFNFVIGLQGDNGDGLGERNSLSGALNT
jgi:hypothetical protein